jgi:transcriptional regulator with XRE-family HTH domain
MRKRAGLNQAQLAAASGNTQTAISNYENGRRPLSIHRMRSFAKILGCTVADLLAPEDNPFALQDDERALVEGYRSADEVQRELIARVAAPPQGYRLPDRDDEAA